MGERLNRTLAKWDASNAATMREHNELAGGTGEEFNERTFAGPEWAYAIADVPVIGWLGVAVIAWANRTRRKQTQGSPPPPPDADVGP